MSSARSSSRRWTTSPSLETDRLLLVATARTANTGMKWNDKRTSLTDWGTEPTLIEPVKGFVTLRGINCGRAN